MTSLESIEQRDYDYFEHICFMLSQDKAKMLKALDSKDKIRNDWIDAFSRIDKKRQNSDFARGAERVYFWLFNQLGMPNSSPIGSDLMFETYNAFIHIDIKTAKFDNTSDYKGKVPIGENQTSYPFNRNTPNLPHYYTLNNGNTTKKYCFTYILNVIYGDKNNSFEIIAVLLIAVPNGILQEKYGNEIIGAGKNKGKSFRFEYSKSPYFKLLPNNKKRIRVIYIKDSIDEINITNI